MSLDDYLDQCFCMAIMDLKISKDQFLDLTPYEFSLLMDYNGKKLKSDAQLLRNTIYNAGSNLLRKKGDKEVPLFPPDRTEIEESDKKKQDLKKERENLFSEIPK